MLWIIVIVVGGIIFFGWILIEEQKRKEEALQNYRASLRELKNNPFDPNLKEQTLRLGRIYSNLMRNSQGQTIFDEVALMNDMNAACAGAQNMLPSNIQSGNQYNLEKRSNNKLEDIEARLEKLESLRQRGLIQDQDYEKKKAEILSEI